MGKARAVLPGCSLPLIDRIAGAISTEAMTPWAYILPRRFALAQSIRREVLKTFSTECELFDVLQNFLFVYLARHTRMLAKGCAGTNRTNVPNEWFFCEEKY